MANEDVITITIELIGPGGRKEYAATSGMFQNFLATRDHSVWNGPHIMKSTRLRMLVVVTFCIAGLGSYALAGSHGDHKRGRAISRPAFSSDNNNPGKFDRVAKDEYPGFFNKEKDNDAVARGSAFADKKSVLARLREHDPVRKDVSSSFFDRTTKATDTKNFITAQSNPAVSVVPSHGISPIPIPNPGLFPPLPPVPSPFPVIRPGPPAGTVPLPVATPGGLRQVVHPPVRLPVPIPSPIPSATPANN